MNATQVIAVDNQGPYYPRTQPGNPLDTGLASIYHPKMDWTNTQMASPGGEAQGHGTCACPRGASKVSTEAQRTFPCPYPIRFPGFNSKRTNCRNRWIEIHRLKEHLQSDIACSPVALHISAPSSSPPTLSSSSSSPYDAAGGYGQEQRLRLMKKKPRKISDEEYWRSMYSIVFPDVSSVDVPSPFADDLQSSIATYDLFSSSVLSQSQELHSQLMGVIESYDDTLNKVSRILETIARHQGDTIRPMFLLGSSPSQIPLSGIAQGMGIDGAGAGGGGGGGGSGNGIVATIRPPHEELLDAGKLERQSSSSMSLSPAATMMGTGYGTTITTTTLPGLYSGDTAVCGGRLGTASSTSRYCTHDKDGDDDSQERNVGVHRSVRGWMDVDVGLNLTMFDGDLSQIGSQYYQQGQHEQQHQYEQHKLQQQQEHKRQRQHRQQKQRQRKQQHRQQQQEHQSPIHLATGTATTLAAVGKQQILSFAHAQGTYPIFPENHDDAMLRASGSTDIGTSGGRSALVGTMCYNPEVMVANGGEQVPAVVVGVGQMVEGRGIN